MDTKVDVERRVGELLLEEGSIDEPMFAYSSKVQEVSRERMGQIMLRLRFATDRDVARVLAKQAGLEYDPMLVVTSSATSGISPSSTASSTTISIHIQFVQVVYQ